MDRFTNVIALFIIISCFVQCKKDDEPTRVNYGAQYFECKVNGEFFEATSTFTCTGLRFSYYPESDLGLPEGYTLLRGLNCVSYMTVGIRMRGFEGIVGCNDFNQPTSADSIYPFSGVVINGELITYQTLIDGGMCIEQLIARKDLSSPYGTIKGTFNFTVTDTLYVDTFRITEGRFRFDVPQIF